MEVQRDSFRLKFEGDGTDDLDVDDVAASLLGSAELVRLAYARCGGDNQNLTIRVKPPTSGSFQIDFMLLATTVITLLSGAEVSAFLNAKELLGLGVKHGVLQHFGLISRPGNSVTYKPLDEQHDVAVIATPYGETRIPCSKDVKWVAEMAETKIAFERISRPIRRGDAESVKVIQDGEILTEFGELDEEIAIAETDGDRRVDEMTAVVQVLEPQLPVRADIPSKKKWGIRWLDRNIRASMEDQVFLRDVNSGKVAFAAMDFLRVVLRVVSTIDPRTKLSKVVAYQIVRVDEKIPRPRQLELPS